ncbi:MAG TPA: MMPL family transporter, partial [Candidatus Dormibacteraeota bacterium]|nr:MMPL family transporter [Candidatus Dormibacteraeota bacterium]
MLDRWGGFVHRHRLAVLGLSAVLLALSVLGLLRGGQFRDPGPGIVEAGQAAKLLDELPKTGGSSFSLMLGSATLRATDPAFRSAALDALSRLRGDPRVAGVDTPFDAGVPPATAAAMTSKDGHSVVAQVRLRDDSSLTRGYYPELRAEVASPVLRVQAAGGVAVGWAFDHYLAQDLSRAEVVSLPLSLILLLLVFGAVVAALLPVGVGALTITGAVAGVLLLTHATDVSQYALNIVTLVGLGVSIDYSLFIVSRFREELETSGDVEPALRRTLATAGRAVVFSGLTVAIGLSGMLFYRGTFLASMGMAGAIAVSLAVLYGLTFLPALLALLGRRVNRFRLPFGERAGSLHLWRRLAHAVMRRPVRVLVPTVGFILLALSPFLHIRLANGDITQLPPAAEVRQGNETLVRGFPGQDQNSIQVVVDFPSRPLSAEHVGELYDLSRRLARLPGALRVQSVVDSDPGLDRAAYQRLLGGPASALPPALAAAVRQNVGPHVFLLQVLTAAGQQSDAARRLVADIRADRAVGDGRLSVTGQTAFDIDFIAYLVAHTPAAMAYIIGVTMVVLFLLLGSVLLPLKAVVMNLLSLSASFGALVWIFQDGHLSRALGFTAAPIDPSIPVLLFCIVFGLSMDYEVMLLSRMREEYRRTGDNRAAVAGGLERSGRLISGAAAIMVAVFAAFGLADVVLIKAIGLGMALAVAIDATVV